MEKADHQTQDIDHITEDDRKSFYKIVYNRRDVRGQFLRDPVPDEILKRVLQAAHHAPSVGFMQPWNFIVVKSNEVKKEVHSAFKLANAEAAQLFDGEKGALYQKLKLEGIMEAPINICVTCDRDRSGKHVLGKTHNEAMDLYSTVCAVQNLWLAARAEGLGLGWVSIFHENHLRKALNIPKEIVPIAYLCIGYVSHFFENPELENKGWRQRLPLEELIFSNQWGNKRF